MTRTDRPGWRRPPVGNHPQVHRALAAVPPALRPRRPWRLALRAAAGALDATPTWVARAAHDVGLAAWFGGAYMGAVALNGASIEVEEPTQRSRVANAGWFRWASVVPVAVGLHGYGALALTRRATVAATAGDAARAGRGTGGPLADGVAAVRGAALAAALVMTAESGRQGRRVAAAGDVPVATAVRPIAETPAEVAAAQRVLRVVQWAIPAATGALIVLDAWQQQHGGTRALPRRWVATWSAA